MYGIHINCLAIPLLILAIGCSGGEDSRKLKLVDASGTLIVPGMDVTNLSLSFFPEDQHLTNAWCRVDKDGKFRLSTYKENDGAAPGKYTVIVSGGVGVMPDEDARLERIPKKYRTQAESDWEVEIFSAPEKNSFVLKVE